MTSPAGARARSRGRALAEELERIHEHGAGRLGGDRPCEGLLAELAPSRIHRDREMRVLGGGEPEGALDEDLARSGLEQIAAPHHLADPLFRVVDDDCKVVGDDSAGTQHDEITDLLLGVLGHGPLDCVAELDGRGADAQPDRARLASRGQPLAAGARIDAVHQIPSRAAARECPAPVREPLERLDIRLRAPALMHDLAVPVHREPIEIAQDGVDGTRGVAGSVEIIDAHEPAPAPPAGVQQAPERRNERAEVQRTGGGRCEAAARGSGRRFGEGRAAGAQVQPICFSRISSRTLQS